MFVHVSLVCDTAAFADVIAIAMGIEGSCGQTITPQQSGSIVGPLRVHQGARERRYRQRIDENGRDL